MILGIDTGGTFTDFVLWRDGVLSVHKCLSTPTAPEQAILAGIQALGLDPAQLRVIHGSTVATNAVLEGKGARTVYIGNRGLGDLLSIGRQARPALYDLQPPLLKPPVPPALCLETGGRLAADGGLLEPLDSAALTTLRAAVARLQPAAVAINLLFCYLDDRPEQAIAAALPPGLFVSRASRVLPLIGEYERGIATWLNARVGPLVAGYLGRLQQGLPGTRLAVMQSSGEAVAAGQAAAGAVRLLLSGPAGGLVGAGYVAAAAGSGRLLSFDMGGTSTDVAMIDGAPRLTTAGRIGDWPVAVPMVDMHTIGAGGGSIARVDAGGLLLVGPASAGVDPGPVCYGRGGTEPTVTDANLVLGRLRADAFLGGRMRLDVAAARAALARLGAALGLRDPDSASAAAAGVIAVANEHMARALRVISVQRGLDPRAYTLCSFGGAGGLHVCALAEALGMHRALVPARAGVLSALGMLVGQPGRLLTRTWLGPLATRDDAAVGAALAELAAAGRQALAREGHALANGRAPRGQQPGGWAADQTGSGPWRGAWREDSVDLRYQGQAYTLNLPWQGRERTAAAFHRLHAARYGHALELPVELVNLRVRLTLPGLAVDLAAAADQAEAAAPLGQAQVTGCAQPVPVLRRAGVPLAGGLAGPAVILDPVATTWLAPGWEARRDAAGNLHLRLL
ncbi:MAG: hydantoinase/oxoprolinase family protein [Chromatiaceae bacterium]|nr:MAG: hydantoinase/oxoprolinase family protein [Chromatiaceae bacterium]